MRSGIHHLHQIASIARNVDFRPVQNCLLWGVAEQFFVLCEEDICCHRLLLCVDQRVASGQLRGLVTLVQYQHLSRSGRGHIRLTRIDLFVIGTSVEKEQSREEKRCSTEQRKARREKHKRRDEDKTTIINQSLR